MSDDLEEQIRRKALQKLTSHSTMGQLIYPFLWVLVSVPAAYPNSQPQVFYYNLLAMLVIAGLRCGSIYWIKRQNLQIDQQVFIGGACLAALHWSLLCAFVISNASMTLGVVLCSACLAALSLSYFAASLYFAISYCAILLLPIIFSAVLNIEPDQTNLSLSITLIFTFLLGSLYWVGRSLNQNYRSLFEYAVHSEKHVQQLEEINTIDGLTGIKNQLFFSTQLQTEWKRAHRQQHPVALLLINIDHLQDVNERHGHRFGDDCVRAVANSLKQQIQRPSDMLARYEGDEFVVILPDTQQVGAMSVGKKILHAIRQIRIDSDTDRQISLTVSIGIASAIPEAHDTALLSMDAARQGLDQAKQDGHDCLRTQTISQPSSQASVNNS